jgi:hypothetical protein
MKMIIVLKKLPKRAGSISYPDGKIMEVRFQKDDGTFVSGIQYSPDCGDKPIIGVKNEISSDDVVIEIDIPDEEWDLSVIRDFDSLYKKFHQLSSLIQGFARDAVYKQSCKESFNASVAK